MTADRNYRLTDIESGRAQVKTADGLAVVGRVYRDQERFNLRRAFVSTFWRAFYYAPGGDVEPARNESGRPIRYRTRDDAATAVVVRHRTGAWA